jgi:hypothetical protein
MARTPQSARSRVDNRKCRCQPNVAEGKQPVPNRIAHHWTEGVVLIVMVVYFVHFCRQALHVRFALDEMMNMYRHWEPDTWKLALANLTFSNDVIRPMAALYYLPLFKIFGFNPLPFNIVRLAIIAVDAFIFFRLAAHLSGSRMAAAMATFVVAYHAEIGNIVYVGSFIYDALCGGFYFAALFYYMRCRSLYGHLDLIKSCVFLGLYLSALNSKEMAVSLPVVLFAYELLYHPPAAWSAAEARRVVVGAGPALAAAIAMTGIFTAVKLWGPGSLTAAAGFVPSYTWPRFFETNVHYLNTIFYTALFNPTLVVLAWAMLLYAAVRRWDRRLLLLWVWVVVTPLPIAFISGRGGACVYIVAAGWALAIFILLETLARQIAREPVFARLPSTAVASCVMASGLALYAYETERLHRDRETGYLERGMKTWNLIQQFQRLPVRPVRGSRVIFLNDPFPGFDDTFFIASLWWDDHSLQIKLQNHLQLPLSKVFLMDYVFDFPEGQLKQLKP